MTEDGVRALAGGRYLLRGVLGAGGAAVVHEATDTRLGRDVAVKLLRDPAGRTSERERFVSEARLLAGLSHHGLVRVLDFGVDEERPFLVLDLVRGTTLGDVLSTGPLPADRVACIGTEIATALAHVHAAGIVHRDVKPSNVLVADDGSIRLTDFGIARLVDDTAHHTRTGMVVGTACYLAPEQVAGERATTAVDVYALGLVLLEALTGRRAFTGTSVETALARLHRRPDLPETLPGPWRSLLAAMTSREPAMRPHAADVADRLRSVNAMDAIPTAEVRRPPAPRRPAARVAGAAAALVLAAGGAVWSLWPDEAPAVATHRARTPDTGVAPSPDVDDGPAAAVELTAGEPGVHPASAGHHRGQPRTKHGHPGQRHPGPAHHGSAHHGPSHHQASHDKPKPDKPKPDKPKPHKPHKPHKH